MLTLEGRVNTAKTALMARSTRNAYLLLMNEMIRFSTPQPRNPAVNTRLGEYKSATRPAKRRSAANGMLYAYTTQMLLPMSRPRSVAMGAVMMNAALVPATSMKTARHWVSSGGR